MADTKTFFEQVPLSVLKQAGLLPCAPDLPAAGETPTPKQLRLDVHGRSPKFIPHQFDVFQAERDGAVLWRGTAESLEQATARVDELATVSPGDYLILDHKSGSKVAISRKAREDV
jgi:hypothetical protein